MSQGMRGAVTKNLFVNQWNFIDQFGFLKGFPKNIPKFVIAEGYGSLIATRLLQ